ncbi:YfbU family protein [Edwardsiella tarda]|uniref:YfbU family protein n=1 Tax=Edwardsiella tarda TaxID=636 RepID=UPI000D50D5DD|nr:YfbU family protein [Edwardsiella tarda]UCQ12812.1 YfbU family protein [Edwardsiella tarda]
MQIKDSEKLILLMLCDLYDKNGVEGDMDHNFIREAIFEQQTWAIPWKFSGIPFEEQDTPPEVKHVLDILHMWSAIEYSYAKLSEEDKAMLQHDAAPFGDNPRFSGFDGNNESELLLTAEFIINKLDRFQEFKGRHLNSHSQKVDCYDRMLKVFNKAFENYIGQVLSREQLTTILLEIIHPCNR